VRPRGMGGPSEDACTREAKKGVGAVKAEVWRTCGSWIPVVHDT
jgi:hypothetical protein